VKKIFIHTIKTTTPRTARRALSLLLTLLFALSMVAPGGIALASASAAPAADDYSTYFVEPDDIPLSENDYIPPSAEEIRRIEAARPANAADPVDTDGDGLPDEWEINGADFNGDGIIDLPLNLMGADPLVPDVYSEIDWMTGQKSLTSYIYVNGVGATRTYQEVLDLTAAEYAAHGINLHIDFGPDSVDYVTGQLWSSYPGGSGGNEFPYSTEVIYDGQGTDNWGPLQDANFTYLRTPVFYHTMVVNSPACGGTGGWGGGRENLIVAPTSYMHEMGHCLGLGHGGSDSVNYKPNYVSIMNYGYPRNYLLYSDYKLPDLNENNLSEPDGIDPQSLTAPMGIAGRNVVYRPGSSNLTVYPLAGTAVDYNADGDATDTGVVQDINNDGSHTVLKGCEDWSLLKHAYGIGSTVYLTLYNITYNANGGIGAPAAQKKLKGQDLILSSTIPTRERMTFLGWATSATGTVEYAPGAGYSAEATVTLYAVWQPINGEFSVTYNKNSADATYTGVGIDVTNGGAATITTVLPTMSILLSRKNFVGWSRGSSMTAAEFLPGQEVQLMENTTLYAVWETPKSAGLNTVANLQFRFPSQEIWVHLGTGHGSDERIVIASSLNANIRVALYPSGSYYQPDTSNPKNSFSGYLTSATDHWVLLTSYETEPATTWETNVALVKNTQYLISYFANGGTGAPLPVYKNNGEAITIPTTTPTRAGYIFLGWGSSPTATTASYLTGANLTTNGNVNLYAVWTPRVSFALSVDTQGANNPSGVQVLPADIEGKVTLPTTILAQADRKNFLGYADAPGATVAQYYPGETLTLASDKTIYALWQEAPTVAANEQTTLRFRYPNQEIWVHVGSGHSAASGILISSPMAVNLQSNCYTGMGGGSAYYSPASSHLFRYWENYMSETNDYWFKTTNKETDPTKQWDSTFTIMAPAQYLVQYYANGGTGAPAAQIKDAGVTLVLSSVVPTHPDSSLEFQGWATSPTATNASYQPGGNYTTDYSYNLYAVWKIKSFAVTYNANGGAGAPAAQSKILNQPLTLAAGIPTRTGHTFRGWALSSDATLAQVVYQPGESYTDNAPLALFAVWTPTVYTVSFNYNGATGGDSVASKPVSYGETYGTLPTPTRTGYSFLGWTTTNGGSTYITESSTVGTGANGQTLYAKWSVNGYTVTYDYQGATGGNGTLSKNVTYGATYGPLPTPTRTGYTFDGWFTGTNGGGTQVLAITIVAITAAQTLFAKWTPREYTVNFNYQSATGGDSTPNKQVTYGETYDTLPVPTRTGYTFGGWYTSTNGGGTNITETSTVSITATQTLYAKWTLDSYLITYDYQGATGDNSVPSKSVNYGATYGTLPTPTRTGYTFGGWFTQVNGGGSQVLATTYVNITAPQTLFAKWTDNDTVVTVTFNYQSATGGNGTPSKTVTYGETYGSLPLPTRTGYTFGGWYTEAGGGGSLVQATSTVTVRPTQTLFAKWTANTYTVTFDYQGATGGDTTPSKIVTFGATYGTLPTPTKTGHTFGGWTTLPNAGAIVGASSTVTTTANGQTLYARWTANSYTVTFDYQGATGGDTTPNKQVTYAATYGALPVPTRTGYAFGGWFTAAGGAGTEITQTTTVGITAAQTLWAKWTINTFTVTYDYQGATGGNGVASKQVTYGESYGTLPTPTRTGYTFIGWTTQAKGAGTTVTSGTTVTATVNHTLYANWAGLSYTLSFNYLGATAGAGTASKTITNGATYGALPEPQKAESLFKGWYTAEKGGTKITADTIVDVNAALTLYARWVKNTPVAGLPDVLSVYRKEDANLFKNIDTEDIFWYADNNKLFNIDERTGEMNFKFAASFVIFGTVRVTAKDADGNVLGSTEVRVTWIWWKWILVIFFFGWAYL
jgi:uncharacterized repeat protein (TIGR02543 family)